MHLFTLFPTHLVPLGHTTPGRSQRIRGSFTDDFTHTRSRHFNPDPQTQNGSPLQNCPSPIGLTHFFTRRVPAHTFPGMHTCPGLSQRGPKIVPWVKEIRHTNEKATANFILGTDVMVDNETLVCFSRYRNGSSFA
ncbi:unnamed protein product [Chondrus crispus]|uniref:Uncharacterized protein n=1 Tax=Chondrus crispus TaxID=2769 RepID=R7QAW3_CHOCR|nr:unnamed protein product [Chondrus crispus]CDF34600.1 unnamed protein product [Chondrus crispus]|eukprot:XP_005714419.1 unnamed protein product [Chondrus crispus]